MHLAFFLPFSFLHLASGEIFGFGRDDGGGSPDGAPAGCGLLPPGGRLSIDGTEKTAAKVAVTSLAALMVTSQAPIPAQAPAQPSNF
jgi:hypothetical protein